MRHTIGSLVIVFICLFLELKIKGVLHQVSVFADGLSKLDAKLFIVELTVDEYSLFFTLGMIFSLYCLKKQAFLIQLFAVNVNIGQTDKIGLMEVFARDKSLYY